MTWRFLGGCKSWHTQPWSVAISHSKTAECPACDTIGLVPVGDWWLTCLANCNWAPQEGKYRTSFQTKVLPHVINSHYIWDRNKYQSRTRARKTLALQVCPEKMVLRCWEPWRRPNTRHPSTVHPTNWEIMSLRLTVGHAWSLSSVESRRTWLPKLIRFRFGQLKCGAHEHFGTSF